MKTAPFSLVLILLSILAFACNNDNSPLKKDIEKEGLTGKVKSSKTDVFEVSIDNGIVKRGQKEKHIIQSYNPYGFLIEKTEHQPDGSLLKKTTASFNFRGTKTKSTEYLPNGEIKETYNHNYDENGNEAERLHYNSTGDLISKSSYKYDNNGKKTEWSLHNPDGDPQMRTTYEYNQKGVMVETRYNQRGEVLNNINYTYNAFDSKGNWTLRVIMVDGIPTTIEARTLKYYP